MLASMKKEKVAKLATTDTAAAQAAVPKMKDQVLEFLKQDVLKWEEAANAAGHWMPKVAESDRVAVSRKRPAIHQECS